ncbi:MAG: M20/M25/M40 family metallo-hydrolase [Alphaproteobacteria bacterium]|uniref:M20/M25/M40 family metallo-hydrolase n=1 Tax=Candidatus Nitrobium versatile TaxID=2884831 RepID=A0A953JE48_9BACT|nr:M20/M25/M40 family metallo-hydrolase [Candidatus Nitrobium versatile]
MSATRRDTVTCSVLSLFFLFLLALLPACPGAEEPVGGAETVRHELKVSLTPREQRLAVEDTVTLPEPPSSRPRFLLHKGLRPVSSTPGVRIIAEGEREGPVPLEAFSVLLPPRTRSFSIVYGGSIHHPVEAFGKEQARGFSQTPGIIGQEGTYLDGSSFWYPRFEEEMVTFTLQVSLPAGWDVVSQGERSFHERKGDATRVQWDSPEPQDEVFLIAAPFTGYSRRAGRITAMAFLRSPDRGLAERYLEATGQYVAMYEKLIGPYPYKKFALVENFWETGFGMPSFTLLGPKVIRLPFIITSSYPHEILHNWWGNGVFPDYRKGNWSEGLTAYLSDHLLKEQQGSGEEYRQTTLQKYADYVREGKDFPLTEFRSRHSSPSEAVGYGKSLMFFHMLRRGLGNAAFVAGLQDFYRTRLFTFASFDDLRRSFEKVSGKNLGREFRQWIERPGAPLLRVSNAAVRPGANEYLLTALLEQVQPGDAYLLSVPVVVTMEGREAAYHTEIVMDRKRVEVSLRLPARPIRLDIDPGFDLFRRLHRDEIPPALSQALGAERMLILLPASAGERMLSAYRELAKVLGNAGPDAVEIRLDNEVKQIPADRAVAVLGWENRFLKEAIAALSPYGVSRKKEGIQLGNTTVPPASRSLVMTARNPKNKDMAIALIASDSAEALPGLGRKLPHYHKYSYLVFEGNEPSNTMKGRWPVVDSPLTAFLPGKEQKERSSPTIGRGRRAPRHPLVALPSAFSAERMTETVRLLASAEMKGRGLGTPELDRAAEFIAAKFREAGLHPGGDGGYFQTWEDRGGNPEGTMTMRNVIGILPGEKRDGQSVVIGAHYDHLGLGWPDVREGNKGKIHPGADDNASGIAVLLELAQVLGKGTPPDRTIVFAAFTGEEAGRRGSRHYVSRLKQSPAEKCVAMINLDTVGRLGKNRLLVLGAGSAREWVHIFRGAGYVTGVEVESVSGELDASDNVSFEEAGIPAVQLFSGPHLDYHRPTDSPEKIDSGGLVKVASVAREAVEYLAGAQAFLTPAPAGGAVAVPDRDRHIPKGERKVGIGTVPDFSFTGKGCRLSGIVPGSPAEACGLREGDIIVRINATPVDSLKDLAVLLGTLSPGSRISITFLREGREMTVDAEVVAR